MSLKKSSSNHEIDKPKSSKSKSFQNKKLENVFEGQFESTISCNSCKYKVINREIFSDLSLQLTDFKNCDGENWNNSLLVYKTF